MDAMRIAVPAQSPGGLAGKRSEHFGHCELFILVDVIDDNIIKVQNIANVAHGSGGCMLPVKLLRDVNVNAIVVSGMGARPLQGFVDAGIKVFFAPKHLSLDVQALVGGIVRNELNLMQEKQACKGHGKCHHHGN